MLAQVFTVDGLTDEMMPRTQEIVAATRGLDGCEGVIVLRDETSNAGLGIALWRDQASLHAAGTKIRADLEEARALGSVITPGQIYDTVIRL